MAFDVVTAMWAIKKGKGYTDSSIGGLAGGFKYKGSVASIEDLPSGAEQGDEYTVGDIGTYVWDGSEWKPAGVQGKEGRPGPPAPAGSVDTVNGKTGPDVILTGSDIDVSDAISDKIGDVIPEMENEIAGKQDLLRPNDTSTTTAKLTKLKIDGINYALQGNGASVFNNYQAMVTEFNSKAKSDLELGWNIYIRTLDVPDLWVSKNDETTSVPYTYSTDSLFIIDLKSASTTGLQIGYYRVNQLEAEKVNVPVLDVLINGTSVLSGGIANVPAGGADTYGVFKIGGNGLNISSSTGRVVIQKASDADIVAKASSYVPIVPANLQLATNVGVRGSEYYQSFSCEMSDGSQKTLKIFCELL